MLYRSTTINIRCCEKEKELLKQRAQDLNISISDLVRLTLFDPLSRSLKGVCDEYPQWNPRCEEAQHNGYYEVILIHRGQVFRDFAYRIHEGWYFNYKLCSVGEDLADKVVAFRVPYISDQDTKWALAQAGCGF